MYFGNYVCFMYFCKKLYTFIFLAHHILVITLLQGLNSTPKGVDTPNAPVENGMNNQVSGAQRNCGSEWNLYHDEIFFLFNKNKQINCGWSCTLNTLALLNQVKIIVWCF